MRLPVTMAAKIFAGAAALVIAFQIALALGAPWGELTMGGGMTGVLPAPMRLAAGLQALVIGGCIVVVLARAGVLRAAPGRGLKGLAWAVAALFAISLVLNLITPGAWERALWAPVALVLFATALRVAASR